MFLGSQNVVLASKMSFSCYQDESCAVLSLRVVALLPAAVFVLYHGVPNMPCCAFDYCLRVGAIGRNIMIQGDSKHTQHNRTCNDPAHPNYIKPINRKTQI